MVRRRQIMRCVLRPAAPTTMSTATLRSNWSTDPLASRQLENASDTPASAAAGMVVTEMNTPMRALALASVRDTTPTSPARMATVTEYMLGVLMRFETGLVPLRNEAGAWPAARTARPDMPGRVARFELNGPWAAVSSN